MITFGNLLDGYNYYESFVSAGSPIANIMGSQFLQNLIVDIFGHTVSFTTLLSQLLVFLLLPILIFALVRVVFGLFFKRLARW